MPMHGLIAVDNRASFYVRTRTAYLYRRVCSGTTGAVMHDQPNDTAGLQYRLSATVK